MSKPKLDASWYAFLKAARKIDFGYLDLYTSGRPKVVKAILFAMTERDGKNFWRSRAANPNRKETK